jgi:Mlc titration factor MtfA (ptsG expression regulator)
MQPWDSRQSTVSAIGAACVVAITTIVILQTTLPRKMLFAAAVLAILFYIFNMRRHLRRLYWRSKPFPEKWRNILDSRVDYYRRLSETEKRRFEQQIKFFLHENHVTGVATGMDDTIRLLIASSAIILIFGHPEWEYSALPEILVYPNSFNEDYAIAPQLENRTLIGQVVPQGGIVIAKDELVRAFENPGEAYHVGLHEFAHALDMTDGSVDGIPGYLNPRMIQDWYDLMKDELEKVRGKKSILNPYAGKNTAELFAVAVEHFFQRPEELRATHKQLYEALASYFQQNPHTE